MTPSQNDSFKRDHHAKTQHPLARKKRKDAGHVRWQSRDYYVLEWIGVQGAIRFDQLQRLLGMESPGKQDDDAIISPSATRNAINRWERRFLINSEHIVPGDQTYYWLSHTAYQFVGLHLPDYTPQELEMPYLLACNQVRLHIELLNRTHLRVFGDPQKCYWVSDRELQSTHPKRKTHLPSGEYWTETRRTLAIEVVITPPEGVEQHMRDYVEGKLGAYSEVWYFALPNLYLSLNETREKLSISGVDVSKITLFNSETIPLQLLPPKPHRKQKGE